MSFSPSLTLEVSSYGHDYTTSSVGLWAVGGAMVCALASLAFALLPKAGGEDEEPPGGLRMVAFMVFALGLGFLFMPLWTWWKSGAPFFGGGEARAYAVFRSMLLQEVGWSAGAALAVVMTVLMLRRRRVSPGPARVSFLLGLLAVLLGFAASAHATYMVRMDCLPRIVRSGHGYLQVGRARRVRAAATCGPSWPTPEPQTVVAERAGSVPITFRIDTPILSVERTLSLRAGEEVGTPRFQLREGNRWVYEHREVTRVTSGYVDSMRRERTQEVVVEVLEPRVAEGLRRFPVRVRPPEGEPTEIELVGFEGALHRLLDDELVEHFPAEPTPPSLPNFFLPGSCTGVPPPSQPAAPTECRGKVGAMAGLSSTMLRILTLGTAGFVPGRSVYVLKEAEWGPRDAPELPVEPARPLPSLEVEERRSVLGIISVDDIEDGSEEAEDEEHEGSSEDEEGAERDEAGAG